MVNDKTKKKENEQYLSQLSFWLMFWPDASSLDTTQDWLSFALLSLVGEYIFDSLVDGFLVLFLKSNMWQDLQKKNAEFWYPYPNLIQIKNS